MTKICANPLCGKQFETSRHNIKYCSKECAKTSHQRQKYKKVAEQYKDKPCDWCGKEHNHMYGSGRFCSNTCKAKYMASKSPVTKTNSSKPWKQNPDKKWVCKQCNSVFSTRKEMNQHIKSIHYKIKDDKHFSCKNEHDNSYSCPYCGKHFVHSFSIGGHIRMCKNNPYRDLYLVNIKKMNNALNEKIKNGLISQSHTHSPETKAKLSNIRTKLYAEGIGLGGMQSRTYKLPNINGEMFFHQGTWELNVAKYLNSQNILWIRNKKIQYIKDNFIHNYIPDYYIPNNDVYVEVKGYFSPDAQLKMKLVLEQNPNIKIYFIHDNYEAFISGKIPFNDELCLTLEYLKKYNS